MIRPSDIVLAAAHAAALVPPMSVAQVDRIRELERHNLARNQVPIATHHLIHAGVYARTITVPKDVLLTGALIKRATVIILSGDALVNRGDGNARFTGYHVLPASANRKQAFFACEDTHLTMLFATDARSVEPAEDEFTDEAALLFSRTGENHITITGET